MKKIFLLIAIIFLMTGCGSQNISQKNLNISAAASLTDVLKKISAEFEKNNPDTKIIFNFGSSGALQQAIENGGETDIFFSAAQKQMDSLENSKNLAENSRKNLLENEIVLISPIDSDKIKNFSDLTQENIKIALGEPKGVPVGQYSEEILKNLGIFDEIKNKFVYGSDVRQVLAWVESGEVDCGIVYATDAKISEKIKIVEVADKNLHKPVIYPVAIIKNAKNFDSAKKFLDFLSTDTAKNIFKNYGFKCID